MNGPGITLQDCVLTSGNALSIDCSLNLIYNFYTSEHEPTTSSCQKFIADQTQNRRLRDPVYETKQLERLIDSLILYFKDHQDLDGPNPKVLVEKLQEIINLTIPSIYKRCRAQMDAPPIRGLKKQTFVKVQGIRTILSTIRDDWEGTWEGKNKVATAARVLESLLGPVWHRFWSMIREPFPLDKVCRDIGDLQGSIHSHILRFDQALDRLPKKVKQIQIEIVDFFGNEWTLPQELCLHRDTFLSVLRYIYQDGPANAVVANRLFSISQKENFKLIRREEWARVVTSGDGLQLSVIISLTCADTKSTQSVKCPRCEDWCSVDWTDLDDPDAESAYCYKCDTSFTVRNSTLEDETFSDTERMVDIQGFEPVNTLGNTSSDSDDAQWVFPIEENAYPQSQSRFDSKTSSNNDGAKASTSGAVDYAAFKYFSLRLTQEGQPEDLFEDVPPTDTRSPIPSDVGEFIPKSVPELGTQDENSTQPIQAPNASVDSQQNTPPIDPQSPTPSDVGASTPTSAPEPGLSTTKNESSSVLMEAGDDPVISQQMIENARKSLDSVFQMKSVTTGRSQIKRLKDVVTECHGQPLKYMTVIVRSLAVARIILEISEEGSQICDCLIESAESKCQQTQRSEEESMRFIDEKMARIQELAGRLEQTTQHMHDEFRGFRLGILNVEKDLINLAKEWTEKGLTDLANDGKEKGFLLAGIKRVFGREDPDAFVGMLGHMQSLVSNILSNLGLVTWWSRIATIETRYLGKNANSNLVRELSTIHLRNVKKNFVALQGYFKGYDDKMTGLYDQYLGLLDMTSKSQVSGAGTDMARDLQNLNMS